MIPILTFLQRDFITLQTCINDGEKSTINDIKRRLSVIQRSTNVSKPNHYYSLENEKSFENVEDITSLFTKSLPKFASEYLEFGRSGKNVVVKEEKFLEWQDLISYISPTLLIAAFLFHKFPENNYKKNDVVKFFAENILENTKNTALLSPDIILLEEFLNKNEGFNDLHIHLNGVLESDAVWQNLIIDIPKNCVAFTNLRSVDNLKQQLEQNGISIEHTKFQNLLENANKLRQYFYEYIFLNQSEVNSITTVSVIHPFSQLFDSKTDTEIPNSLVRYECLFYYLLLCKLYETKNEKVAFNFYIYIQIQGLFQELSVQNQQEYGFEQFQNKTKARTRTECDKKQVSKFLQLSGNKSRYIKNIEFRFSPQKKTNHDLLTRLENEWNIFNKKIAEIEPNKKDYTLIAHFIKQSDKNEMDDLISFKCLRNELEEKKDALIGDKKSGSIYSKRIVGIDVAASEFDTPPEVFAPIYKDLRENGFQHFTYHAGEDFYHVLSGLRAIYEAVNFCELKKGDRIGHAAASGIDIEVWEKLVGKRIYIPKGEYMDDLLFAYNFIIENEIDELKNKIPSLILRIQSFYEEIYDDARQISELSKAWKARCYHPEKLDKVKECSQKTKEIIGLYNRADKRKKYNEPVSIDIEEDFTKDEMIILQKKILSFLHDKEIVIETLPTSNLRIGCHSTFDSYQLITWYEWREQGVPLPPIVIGSDDPGIFSTNIYNEYALVYCYLVYKKKKTRSLIMEFLETLYKNSQIYLFEKS